MWMMKVFGSVDDEIVWKGKKPLQMSMHELFGNFFFPEHVKNTVRVHETTSPTCPCNFVFWVFWGVQ